MHAILLTLLVVAGADQPQKAPVAQAPANQAAQAVTQDECAEGCDQCGGTGEVARRYPLSAWFWDVIGPMPQTCYNPHFGCYPGASRTMHRYPAFHGYYYRQPYNYRHLFDYPWHATPHEPVGFFAYQRAAGAMEDCPEGEMGKAKRPTGAMQATRGMPRSNGNVQARYHGPRPPQKVQR